MPGLSRQNGVSVVRIPVIVDTDIGLNIDDALCLGYLLRQPRCELLGITTTSTLSAELASSVCHAFGRPEIPIHCGSKVPLIDTLRENCFPQKIVLANWRYSKQLSTFSAVRFLREIIHDLSGQITLLSIGPLSNVGRLFAVDPEIPGLLRHYVGMGGVYFGPVPNYGLTEWNTICDPLAAAIVFGANIADMRCIGLDVTTKCRMPAEECRAHLSDYPFKIINDMGEAWFQGRSEVIFHDPLAAAVIFDPRLCRYESGLVEIDLEAGPDQPLTRFTPNADRKPHQVAVSVDPKAFFEHYFAILAQGSPGQVDFPPETS